jgi:hypothetical protein
MSTFEAYNSHGFFKVFGCKGFVAFSLQSICHVERRLQSGGRNEMVFKDSYETEGMEVLLGKGGPLALAGFHKDSGNFELQSSC